MNQVTKIMLKGLFLAGLSLIFSQVCLADGRTDKTGPGDDGVEVIAGTGYQHTLFDSAEKKCQNCHNDLYDTWKTSMHAKSWKDPIFQSKYQDFLRLQASKIGAVGPTGTYSTGPDPDGDGTYLSGTIQKTGQVCIKCHAPTAFYSSDYKITLTEVGDMNEPASEENLHFNEAKSLQSNLAPAYDPSQPATVTSLAKTGKVYTVSYHIGNSHNREGINCSYCHSMETVRMMNDTDNADGGQYKLAKDLKMGPIGPIVRYADDILSYSPDASTPDMNAFFGLIGPEKYANPGDTPKEYGDFDVAKGADGRYTMKSVKTGCDDPDDANGDGDLECHYTGGPFYGPFGVTGLSNSRSDDAADRAALVKQSFVDAVDANNGDKFTSEHQFAGYGKALCLSCHQRSSLAINPESNGQPGLQVGDDQFLELCSTWTAMSDGVGDNYTDTSASPKCQKCHMEPLEIVTVKNEETGIYDIVKDAVVLHQWDQPDKLFTLADNPDLTEHFLPLEDGGEVGPVAEGYLNNHAFMGANKADFGLTKILTGFESSMSAKKAGKKIKVDTKILNKTAHMFPGAHPMRRVMTRVVVTDANGNKLNPVSAIGDSDFKTITNQVAVLAGNTIKAGHETVKVEYDGTREINIQGYGPDLDNEAVFSQVMDQTLVDWVSPDATVTGSSATYIADCDSGDVNGDGIDDCWAVKGETTVKKITDVTDGTANHFSRVYGRETGKRKQGGDYDGSHVVRPGFDSNIAADNRLKPNEFEKYKISFDASDATYPVTVKYKVYYMKKGASGKFPAGADGFLNTSLPASTLKKLAIYEVYSKEVIIE